MRQTGGLRPASPTSGGLQPHPPPSGTRLGRTRRRTTRPLTAARDSASTQRSATRALPGDGGGRLGLHPTARDSASTRRRNHGRHPMKHNSGFTRQRRWRWREEPWRAQRHDDDMRMAATTTQRCMTALLPLDGDGSKATARGATALLLLEGDGLKA
jgi:hypothetical protein